MSSDKHPHDTNQCSGKPQSTQQSVQVSFSQGCMVCGRDLVYFDTNRQLQCEYCGTVLAANASCTQGHFICDTCHASKGIDVIRSICLTTEETDMITLLKRIRLHPSLPTHGPEHHAMVPGIILATCRNLGIAEVTDEMITSALDRGRSIPGGNCAFVGACGAALGAGIAFSMLIQSSPLQASARYRAQDITLRLLKAAGQTEAARCCQRECYNVLKAAVDISAEVLGTPLQADDTLVCEQVSANKQCIGIRCPIHPHAQAT